MSCEEIDSDELEGDLNLSGDEINQCDVLNERLRMN
jgi:hypothetical protein